MRVAAVAAVAVVVSTALSCRSGPPPPATIAGPIVLISVDTLRADRLPIYGYERVDTPALDTLAQESWVFERAFTQAPTTLPAHTSLFTGMLPSQHGVRDNFGYTLPGDVRTLAATLSAAGWRTAAFVSAYPLRAETGLDRGFDVYDDELQGASDAGIGEIWRPGAATLEHALAWLNAQADARFFLFLHLYEPHAPYEPAEPYASRYGGYDGEIAMADALVGRLLDALRRRRMYDPATIVFLSDHGESLGEHGEDEHGVFLYTSVLHVPLAIKPPASSPLAAPRRVQAPVQLIDVAPTLSHLAGVAPWSGPGKNLLRESLQRERLVYAETFVPRLHFGWSELYSVIEFPYHYIDAPDPELYDLQRDPGETRNLWAAQPRRATRLRQALAALKSPLQAPAEIGAAARDRLAALGYLGGRATSTEGTDLPDPKTQVHLLRHLKTAARSFFASRYREAVAEYEAILAENPRMAAAWEFLGRAQLALGELEGAAASFRRLAELSGRFDAYLHWGDTLLALGDLAGARSAAAAAERLRAGSARLLQARIALAAGELAVAEARLASMLEQEPGSLQARYYLALTWFTMGRLQDAARLVVESRPHDARRRAAFDLLQGRILLSEGKAAEAISPLQAAVEATPGDLEAWGYLAVAQIVAGDGTAGRMTLERMAGTHPDRRAYLLAADVLSRLGLADEASHWRARAEARFPVQ